MNQAMTNWKWGFFEGTLLMVLGWIAIAHPFITSLSVTLIIGSMLLITGVMLIWRTWKNRQKPNDWAHLLTGIVSFLIGLFIVYDPLISVITFTALLMLFFFVQGINSLVIAWKIRRMQGMGCFVLYGLVSLAMAGLLWSQWPSTALWFIGILFGINLVMSGAALTTFSFFIRNEEKIGRDS